MTEAVFQVKTEKFEGPLDLLLALIEKRKLYINDISLASVADDFISYVNELKEFPLSQAAHFVLVASTLLLIKSRSLLPTLSLTEEEEGSIDDLEKRLKLYKRFKELSKNVARHFGRAILFTRSPIRREEAVFSPASDLSVASLAGSIERALANLPKEEPPLRKAVVAQVMSLEEAMDQLALRIKKGISMSFQEFSGAGKEAKVHVIVSFLALLELVKQGVLAVKQDALFSDITMESDTVDTPHYGT